MGKPKSGLTRCAGKGEGEAVEESPRTLPRNETSTILPPKVDQETVEKGEDENAHPRKDQNNSKKTGSGERGDNRSGSWVSRKGLLNRQVSCDNKKGGEIQIGERPSERLKQQQRRREDRKPKYMRYPKEGSQDKTGTAIGYNGERHRQTPPGSERLSKGEGGGL